MARGTVKWFNDQKGYGFISTEEGQQEDIFVHFSAIECQGFKTLHEGDAVQFEMTTSARGSEATRVNRV